MAQLVCENVRLSYDNRIVLSGLDLSVDAGDYVCIVGENGSGKSTLVKAILSLIPVAGGRISFGDGLKGNEIGYLPQQTGVQKDFPTSVWEVVLSGCLNARGFKPFYSKAEKERALLNLEKMNLLHYKNHSYRELSGGQQQRVLLARAMCATKKMLLLDEPVAGLDPVVTGELYDRIRKINGEGVTVLMVCLLYTSRCV